jgi:hypothetical protein
MATKDQSIADDRLLIEKLGGPAKVADLMGYEKHGGVQRVHNWQARGIPPAVKFERPDLFLVGMSKAQPAGVPIGASGRFKATDDTQPVASIPNNAVAQDSDALNDAHGTRS